MSIIKYYNLVDNEVFIFDDFIINQIKEGVAIESRHNDIINNIVLKYFSGRNMVYISNRMKSYSVNPLIYSETEKIPNLVAIALIPKTAVMRKNAQFEREFYNKPYEIFDNLPEAIKWAQTIISKADAEKKK